jgi:patatin-like phospholipase/acyl hydrolase
MYETIILSGGGTKGFCILGSLQYLQDTKRIDCSSIKRFVGTSIGSIISFFIAIGYTPMELVVYLCSHNILESLSLNGFDGVLKGDGVYQYSTLSKMYEEMIREKINFIPTLRDVKERFDKDLIMCTYNSTKKRKEYVSYRNYPDLSCLDAMRMSSNLPFIFSPFWYNSNEYIDGGIVENFSFSAIPILMSYQPNQPIEEFVEYVSSSSSSSSSSSDIVNVTIKVIGHNNDNNNDKNIIGICLSNNMDNDEKENEQPTNEKEKKYNKITSILDKIYDLVIVSRAEHEDMMINKYKEVIELVTIHAKGIKVYTFQLLQSEKLELFSLGYNKTKQHFTKINI